MLKAVVLSGGFATRLRPISYALPKLLFPVAGKPMIYWTLDLLRRHGVDQVVLAVNYLADTLRAVVGERYKTVKIRYSLEDKPLGTGGPVKLAARTLKPLDTFIVMNGDIITELDLTRMLKEHQESHAVVTDALHEVRNPSRFGVVQLDDARRIRRFVEKPRPGQAPSRLINAGIYMIEPSLLSLIPPNRKVSLERDIFPILARKGRLSGFPFRGRWFDVGDLSDYSRANFELLKTQQTKGVRQHGGKQIKPPVLIGEDTRIEPTARVGPNVVTGKNCMILRRARLTNSILFDGVTVGENAIVARAIVATNAHIGRGVRINPGAIVSPNVKIADGVSIGNRAIIHPHKEITSNVPPRAHVM